MSVSEIHKKIIIHGTVVRRKSTKVKGKQKYPIKHHRDAISFDGNTQESKYIQHTAIGDMDFSPGKSLYPYPTYR